MFEGGKMDYIFCLCATAMNFVGQNSWWAGSPFHINSVAYPNNTEGPFCDTNTKQAHLIGPSRAPTDRPPKTNPHRSFSSRSDGAHSTSRGSPNPAPRL